MTQSEEGMEKRQSTSNLHISGQPFSSWVMATVIPCCVVMWVCPASFAAPTLTDDKITFLLLNVNGDGLPHCGRANET